MKSYGSAVRVVFGVVFVLLLVSAVGCDSVYMKGTPFYTGEFSQAQAPPEDRVNFWPLAYYDDPALSVLWPVGEHTDDHKALRPLFSVYKLDQEEHEYNFLWPLMQFDYDTDDHRVFPMFWGRDGNDPYAVLFPLVWYWGDETWSDMESLAVFPIFWYGENSYFGVFPLFLHGYDDSSYSTHVLPPIFHYKRGEDEKGWRFWPLAGSYERDDESYRFLLWPLAHEWRDDDDAFRMVLPLYFGGRSEPDESWNLLAPLFWRSKEAGKSLFLSPLYSAGRDGNDKWQMLFPLYFRSREDDRSTILTPLFGKIAGPDRDTWIFSPLASSYSTEEDAGQFWFLAPLAHARWGGGESRHHVLPFYYYNSGSGTFMSPLASWRRAGEDKAKTGFLNVLGPLFNYWSTPQGKWRLFAPFPFVSVFNDGGGKGFRVWPLTGWRSRGDRSFESDALDLLLLKVFRYRSHPRYRTMSLFPLFTWAEQYYASNDEQGVVEAQFWRSDFSFFPSFTKETRNGLVKNAATGEEFRESKRTHGLWPLWDYEYLEQQDGKYRASEFSLLAWLYDYKSERGVREKGFKMVSGRQPKEKTEPVDMVRSRILWQVMHYERVDQHTSLDIFPFITWDRKADTKFKKFSFAWRLFRYERDDEGRLKMDLLFIPVRRQKALAPPAPIDG